MAQAIVIREYGGPDVLRLEDVHVGRPARGQVRIRHTRIGVNFHDSYTRSGQHRALALPGSPGIEAVGVVEEVGDEVTNVQRGDRFAYVTPTYGVYATERLIDAGLLLRIPLGVTDQVVASSLLRGLTVDVLVNRAHHLKAGSTILVQAAGGGVGQLLTRWARRIGVTVIGTAGNEASAQRARDAGCHHVLSYKRDDVAARVKQITGGAGVAVAYDAVGADTFDGSLESLDFCGMLVNYGQASGPIPPFQISRLSAKSSAICRPIVFHYTRDASTRRAMAENYFQALEAGWLFGPTAVREFPLAQAAECHRVMEAEGTGIPLLLVP